MNNGQSAPRPPPTLEDSYWADWQASDKATAGFQDPPAATSPEGFGCSLDPRVR